MSVRTPVVATLNLVAALVLTAGCTRAADESRLTVDLQARLNRDVKPDLFEVVSVRREGSAPMPPGDAGAERVIVYFNATLQLAQDYTFGGWDQLGASSVAFALGAKEKGLFGLQPENHAGDLVRAYGTAIYQKTGDGWTPIVVAPSGKTPVPNVDDAGTPLRSKQLIDRIASMVALPPPGIPPPQDAIIAEELARAQENIERRVKRREHTFTIATGPEDTEYARFGDSIIAAVTQAKPGINLRQRYTQGSVENATLLSHGEADYAIVQGDVAAAASAGEDLFARGGAMENLRAVGALFPEAVHIVVLADSPIRDVAQLRGRRVSIGAVASGTRFDALAVLAAYGMKPADLSEANDDGPVAAIDRLRKKRVDAVFLTAVPPIPALQQLSVTTGMRLLPVTPAAIERLTRDRQGLTPMSLPPNTYPKQSESIATVASAALLLTTTDAPHTEVEHVADLVFRRMPQQRGAADVVKVSRDAPGRGITVPLHSGAAAPPR